jgi:stearoyl-CoA desaturase (Delta-9 desaturase)
MFGDPYLEIDSSNSEIVHNKEAPSRKHREFIPSSRYVTSQRFHFFAVTALPAILVIAFFYFYPSVNIRDLNLLIGMWVLTGGLGISLGYHRYYTHGGFAAHPILESAMAISGSMAGQGPITYWVTLHRCHHQHSDDELDPHSPIRVAGASSM